MYLNLRKFHLEKFCVGFADRLFAGAGGGIFISCADLDQLCMQMMEKSIGLPNVLPAIALVNNSAEGYGNSIATLPVNLEILGRQQFQLIPGIDLLNVSLRLKDGLGQIILGTLQHPIPYILDFWLCPSSQCTIGQSLAPLKFLSFDSDSGLSNSLAAAQTVRCAYGASNVTAEFGVHGTNVPLTSSVTIDCRACGTSQVRAKAVIAQVAAWFCVPCLAGQYIIDPDRYSCKNCPAGALVLFSKKRTCISHITRQCT